MARSRDPQGRGPSRARSHAAPAEAPAGSARPVAASVRLSGSNQSGPRAADSVRLSRSNQSGPRAVGCDAPLRPRLAPFCPGRRLRPPRLADYPSIAPVPHVQPRPLLDNTCPFFYARSRKSSSICTSRQTADRQPSRPCLRRRARGRIARLSTRSFALLPVFP